MANYTITCACGHEIVKQLFGPEAKRQSYIAWAERNLDCPDCTKAAEADAAAAAETRHTLPELTGSDKQIAWARTIRAKHLDAIAALLDSRRPLIPADEIEAFEAWARAGVAKLSANTAAKWWIKTRDTQSPALFVDAAGPV